MSSLKQMAGMSLKTQLNAVGDNKLNIIMNTKIMMIIISIVIMINTI
jgi:hypothetical protein